LYSRQYGRGSAQVRFGRRRIVYQAEVEAILRITLAALLLAAACGDAGNESASRFAVTDSAGVELVHNGNVGSLGPDLLVLTEELRLGAADGPDVLQFYRIGPVRIDPAGSIYVPDNGSGELRIFSRDGTFQRKIGRRGSGPGEFQLISNVLIRRDHVIVVDGGLRRTTSFAADGSVRDTWPFQMGSVGVVPLGRTESRWVVAVSTRASTWPYQVGVARQDTTRIATLSSLTAPSAGTPDLHDVVRYPRGRLFGIASPRAMTANSPVWEPRPNHAIDGQGRTFVSDGREYRIDVFDASGRLLRRIRRQHEPVAVTSDLFDRYAGAVRTYYDTVSTTGRLAHSSIRTPRVPPRFQQREQHLRIRFAPEGLTLRFAARNRL
jgi:hypothetical protein